jgi:phosphate/sulfate permease
LPGPSALQQGSDIVLGKALSLRTNVAHRKLVRRSHFLIIVAARVVTVPEAALLSAVVFYGTHLLH